jgi:poly-gamma-glutamate capsule biosynthesis protein CapA/YwtB (metallophosphatase superfamily)
VSMHMHWPGEENDVDGRQLIARAAIDAGADTVFGTGPRVLNGVELYKNQPIFYGIGNLAFQFTPESYQLFPDTQKFVRQLIGDPKNFTGLAVRMTLSPQGKARRIELLPIRQTPDGAPHLAGGNEGAAILDDVKARSEKLGTSVKRQSWYALIELPTADRTKP